MIGASRERDKGQEAGGAPKDLRSVSLQPKILSVRQVNMRKCKPESLLGPIRYERQTEERITMIPPQQAQEYY